MESRKADLLAVILRDHRIQSRYLRASYHWSLYSLYIKRVLGRCKGTKDQEWSVEMQLGAVSFPTYCALG